MLQPVTGIYIYTTIFAEAVMVHQILNGIRSVRTQQAPADVPWTCTCILQKSTSRRLPWGVITLLTFSGNRCPTPEPPFSATCHPAVAAGALPPPTPLGSCPPAGRRRRRR